ncbi:extracellular solute-binding protein [Saccharibacillus sp. CPCC 101409]|uniref:extracellular solute-binding protein n=1 Tax=Saccharibacillus sp. CPCC 101409 TaxID=3058041 RepID=UPI00267136D8|nr:extracellular solute-binding protein [Saccharibacillus sp. CPCC 101409]MDO3412481.1 extracellular solute-binding protein [Saccharibacillus sp. CPCC 101409]
MRKRWTRHAALGAALLLGLTGAAGCSGGGNEQAEGGEDGATPISIWASLNTNVSITLKSMNEIAAIREWEKKTGIKAEFQHPAVGAETEQFNVMLASNELPDVMFVYGDYAKLYNDGSIIRLNDLIDEFAPNLKKILDENPEVAKQLKADNGDIYAMPHLRLGEYKTFGGMFIRQDWLDELGLARPETLDEWETVLKAFKEKKGVSAPLLYGVPPKMSTMGPAAPNFLEAYGITNTTFLKDGKVAYGPIEPEYKEFLTLFHRWYEEGLIDPDFATNDQKTFDAKILDSQAGAFFTFIGGGIGRYLPALQEKDPDANLTPVQYPVENKGDEPMFTGRSWEWSGAGATITKSNKNPEETVKALDYFFGEEGHMLKNFGIEGETYTMKNGYPTYTDEILHNPDGLSVVQAMAKYFIANYPFVGEDDDRYNEQYYQLQQQKDAVKLFSKYSENTVQVSIPPVSLTTEESNEYSKIMNDITTYRDEMFIKFAMGAEPIDNFDSYVAQIKKFNIDRALEIQQNALDRYNAR